MPKLPVTVAFFVAGALLLSGWPAAQTGQQPAVDRAQAPRGTLPTVTDYQLVRAHDVSELEGKVKKALQDRWIPHGGVMHAEGEFIQPMVKHN